MIDTTWGIPTLDPAMQVRESDLPPRWVKWGSHARRFLISKRGLHFYCVDRKFTALWKHPQTVVNMDPACVVEPNYSSWAELPPAVSLHDTFRKRSIALAWQRLGLRVLVDLNVHPNVHPFGLLGVPIEWRAFATRAHRSGGPEAVAEDFAWASRVQGIPIESMLCVVFGGGKLHHDACQERGWHWVPEDARTVRGLPACGGLSR